MGWLTDIGVSRLFGQQGTTGGAPRPGCAEAVGSPSTGHGRPLTVAGRPLASPRPPPRWARSSGRDVPRQRLKSGDPSSAEIAKKVARKVCAQLALSISLISEVLRLPLI